MVINSWPCFGPELAQHFLNSVPALKKWGKTFLTASLYNYSKKRYHFFKKLNCPSLHFFFQSTGSLQITASQIICPKHYTPPKKKKIIHHVNTSWCFICSKGGALICCESCPASFHVDCLKIPDLNPEAKYFCDNCETGRMHLYGEVS
jgi:hypothetical protein